MRHFVSALILGILLTFGSAPVFPQPPESENLDVAAKEGNGESYFSWGTLSVGLSTGYRIDKLDWNIAGNPQGSNPNILSELAWSDLHIYQLKLANRTVIKDRVYLRCHLDYGWVTSGDNQDSDYNGDNRTGEYSRSLNGVDGNHVWDGSVGVGPRFLFLDTAVAVCPMIGYAVSEQDLNIVDGYQAFTAPPATTPTGPFPGLDSRYQTRWNGPWIGVDFAYAMPCTSGWLTTIKVVFTGEYHWVEYEADANWNLRNDFSHPVSFTHDADGNGWVAGAALVLKMKNHWGINLGMNFKEMTTDEGLDRTYFRNGTVTETRLNEVCWRSFAIDAGVSYQF